MAIWKQILIVLVLAVIGAVGWMQFGRQAGGSSDEGGPMRRGSSAAYVVTAPALAEVSGSRLRAVGTAEARQTVSLYPEISGQVTAVYFGSGEVVTEGSPLVQLDDADQQLAVEAASIMAADAEATVERYSQLVGNGAVSTVVMAEATTSLDAARNELARAHLELDRRTILAPISGQVGIVDLEPGDRVTTDTLITRIDDSATLIVDFTVPERYAGQVYDGQPISATTSAFPDLSFEGEVTALDSRLDPASRTLTVRAEIDNDGRLRPGLAFAVELTFEGETYPAVEDIAVQWDRGGSYVWTIEDDVAVRLPVDIVERRGGIVLLEGDLEVGDEVVVAGSQRLSDGSDVTLTPPDQNRPASRPAGAGG
ncbi:MAG: efflux RND transporter periplasmic adaptor subunit [Pseudomonadota bacterium]